MYLRYCDLKIFGLFSAKNDIFFFNISKNTRFCDFLWCSTWKYMKNQQKQSLKAFLAPENHYFDHLWYSILYRKLGKSAISVIPGSTQTRISWARNWILTFCKKRLLRIKKEFYSRSTCIFDPGPPYPLKEWWL